MNIRVGFLLICVTTSVSGWFEKDRAVYAAQKNDWQKAENYLNMLLVDHPEDPAILYDAGVVAFEKKDFALAGSYFKKAADYVVDTSDTNLFRQQLYFNAGNTAVAQKQLREAIEWYDKVLALNFDHERARHNKKIVQDMLRQQEQQQKNQDQNQQQQSDEDEQDQDQSQDASDKQDQKKDQEQKQDQNDQQKENKQSNCPCNNQSGSDQKKEGSSKEQPGNNSEDSSSGSQSGSKKNNPPKKAPNDKDVQDKGTNQPAEKSDNKEARKQADSSDDASENQRRKNNAQTENNSQKRGKDKQRNEQNGNEADQEHKQSLSLSNDKKQFEQLKPEKQDSTKNEVKKGMIEAAQKNEEGVDSDVLALLRAQEARDKKTQAQIVVGQMQQNSGRKDTNGW